MPEAQLSTMWAQKRASHIREFFLQGEAAGFSAFELGHHVRPGMLDGAQPGHWHVPSLHAPCPNPSTLRELSAEGVLPSSLDEEKRREAVTQILGTVDLALQWGAKAVVVHLGRVDIDPGIEGRMRELHKQEKKDSEEYRSLYEILVELRARHREPNFEATINSLREIVDYASGRGIAIGLENRFYYQEIPDHAEMGILLGEYPPSQVGYWHDTGHAQVLENLGFTAQRAWLEAYAPRMVGVHFHDVVGVKDHRVAGEGEIDFAAIARYLPPETLRVCEFDHNYTEEEIARGREDLRQAGCFNIQ